MPLPAVAASLGIPSARPSPACTTPWRRCASRWLPSPRPPRFRLPEGRFHDDRVPHGTPTARDPRSCTWGGLPTTETRSSRPSVRQRPWWTFPGRWLPMADILSPPAFAPRVPWRAITVAFLIGALLLAATVAYLGSRQTRVPPPFGLAENGLLTYSADGDIWTTDLVTGDDPRDHRHRRRLSAHLLARRDEDRVPPQGHRQRQPRPGDRRRERGRVEPDCGLPTAGGASSTQLEWAPDSRSLLTGVEDQSRS